MNRKEIYRQGFIYLVTRRIIQRRYETVLRVRVQAWKGITMRGEPVLNEYRDYTSFAKGDMVFARHIAKISGWAGRQAGEPDPSATAPHATAHEMDRAHQQGSAEPMKTKPRTLRRAKYFNGYVTSDGRYEIKAGYGLSIRGGSVSRPTGWTLVDRQGEFKPTERPLLADIRDILKERS